jgi:arsenite oxidase small subunit
MKHCDKLVDVGRRQFFRGGGSAAAAGLVVTLHATMAAANPAPARVSYPDMRLANLKDLKVNEPYAVAYPDKESPGVLLKLGQRVEGGIGPDGDIVAFSTLCPHRGFALVYGAKDRTLNCPGHYARFDCEKGGQEIFGHAAQNLAQFRLRLEPSGEIHAEAVDEAIYGRLSNVLEG